MFDLYDNDFEKEFDEAVDAIEKKEHRLIWADDLIACKFKNDISYNAFANLVRRQPTIEAEPTKHGRWIPYEFATDKRWRKCSVCGTADEYINKLGLVAIRNYCPFCGAKMDEVEK